jgi:diguanylate cyclase (GGDEF)-like protein
MEDRAREYRRTPGVAEGRPVAGVLAGTLFITGGIVLATVCFVTNGPGTDRLAVVILGALAIAWGVYTLIFVDWRRSSQRLLHVSGLAGLALIGLGSAFSGGARSPAWICLFFILVFALYFHETRVAALYLVLCTIVAVSPLVYDPDGLSATFLAQLAITLPVFVALGVAVISGKSVLARQRARAVRVAAEQVALRHIAVAVAAGESPERVYALASEELAAVLGVASAGIMRREPGDRELAVLGSWSDDPARGDFTGARVPLDPDGEIFAEISHGRAVRIERHPDDSLARRMGYANSILAPVFVDAGVWGLVVVSGRHEHDLKAGDEERLTAFASLLSVAIASLEDRARLSRLAFTDPLTGLANHRALHEHLAVEASRAQRHGRPLAVAVVDIDRFKQINDSAGHAEGDRILGRVAEVLRELSRREDILARLGGDEFAWVFPEADAEEALAALQRAQLHIARGSDGLAEFTISAGIADYSMATDPAGLLQLADAALYSSKSHGRNTCRVYSADMAPVLSAGERAEAMERASALLGLRALARAIDAKDPLTRRHSERVSELVGRLALACNWSEERALMLEEAALVHDVGKIGVPDAVLLKVGSLAPHEYSQIKQHAELGARIVGDVLGPEQVAWIRSHHERPDGLGYPHGLCDGAIPEGAALLSVADAWDVMTFSRPYAKTKPPAQALAECRSLVGRQFTAAAVDALTAVHNAEGLPTVNGDDGGEWQAVGRARRAAV